jgi:hypothetical protein
MTEARDIAKPLREFMNKYKFTASDIMRGLVVIINGKQGKKQPAVLAEPCTT